MSCAITGSIHTPTMSPYLPVSAETIGTQAIDAARAGAAILHLHARVEGTGAPSQKPEDYARFLPRIRDNCDAVVNITTGGGLGMSLEDRLAPALAFAPELASMNMGSLNFNISGAAAKIKAFQHDWERPYLEMTKDFILSNTFTQIERGIRALSEQGTRFEYECYDIGHLYNLAHFLDRGLVDGPLFVQGVFGILGGITAEAEHLLHMRRTADRLFGDQYVMSVLAAGRHQMTMAVTNATLGGHVRVGLEDSIYIGKGELAKSNAEQVEKITRILNELSIETATPDEARAMLGLKGAAHVKF
ncbi:3-keto-5-aminohexanoate cleavage protein [Paracoccus sp. DMF]|uniref:3-keto-5-aminohexanoate cleavage protein n=1 Tax=Paracoccus sp. DMF TaxID=400837 RepID=UPI0021E3ED49|nr:3-keto-5-aminohexanoate cleavage protein [Paracoccus sp. DMF]MCV2448349.1 3-keto-5-aminohexanoate cleavage protein [Paracoccus sp. DMF]